MNWQVTDLVRKSMKKEPVRDEEEGEEEKD